MKNSLLPDVDHQTWQGLSDAEAAARLQVEGFNELPSAKPRTWFEIAWDVVREPMLLLLLAAGSVNFLLGEPMDGR